MQLDTVDVFARRILPYIIKITDLMKRELTREMQVDLEMALSFYRDWDGDMTEESIAASIHMHYWMGFQKSLFFK